MGDDHVPCPTKHLTTKHDETSHVEHEKPRCALLLGMPAVRGDAASGGKGPAPSAYRCPASGSRIHRLDGCMDVDATPELSSRVGLAHVPAILRAAAMPPGLAADGFGWMGGIAGNTGGMTDTASMSGSLMGSMGSMLGNSVDGSTMGAVDPVSAHPLAMRGSICTCGCARGFGHTLDNCCGLCDCVSFASAQAFMMQMVRMMPQMPQMTLMMQRQLAAPAPGSVRVVSHEPIPRTLRISLEL